MPFYIRRGRVPSKRHIQFSTLTPYLSQWSGYSAAAAIGSRAEFHPIAGGDHYLSGRPHLVESVADHIAAFAERLE